MGNACVACKERRKPGMLLEVPGEMNGREVASCFSPYNYEYTAHELDIPDTVLPSSDLQHADAIWIVTTAALPWMTGTAVNPLLRAANLSNTVHLVLPWLELEEDREFLYGKSWRQKSVMDQEAYMRDFLSQPNEHITFHWYNARYHKTLGSIFAVQDVCETLDVDDDENSICILEEPEHLNYYRGGHWRHKFRHVVGIVHTNYESYAIQKSKIAAPLVGAVSAWMVRAYCDQVIHLSATLPSYAREKEIICNVHGVRDDFFRQVDDSASKIYFLGKLLWAKGLDKLLELQEAYKENSGDYFAMDIFGSGPEETEIREAYNNPGSLLSSSASSYLPRLRKATPSPPLPIEFLGRLDHAKLPGSYKIFVNPSLSEVLCTVTAEAVAMGKFVILPDHPSNDFFRRFANVKFYASAAEFCEVLDYAMQNEPPVVGNKHELSWAAATERLLRSASISQRQAARRDRLKHLENSLAELHISIGQGTTGNVVRGLLGGGPISRQPSLTRSSSASSDSALF